MPYQPGAVVLPNVQPEMKMRKEMGEGKKKEKNRANPMEGRKCSENHLRCLGANLVECVVFIMKKKGRSTGPSYSQPAENFFQGKELKDGDELASANENFRLGFFKLSGKAYLGIWYNRNDEKPSSDANRRTPISDKSSVLTIDDYGNLKISYSGDQSIVLCLVQGASNTSAILLDTDNFRLHQIMNSDGSTKWNMRQSFDNTTDTLLPGLKLGLGFFSGSGRKRYVGIWHKQADVGNAATDWKLLWVADYGRNPSTRGIWNEQDNLGSSRAAEKPVWVANWNTPVLDKSGILTIGNDGHLKILHDGGVEIVLFSATLVNNASATLLDSGNFVVHELNSDGSIKQVLWQSFDHPTDTLLPGMKIGINTKTGHRWSLTSWSTEGDPAAGSFKLGMDPNNTKQLIIWWQGEIYWVSGLWQNSSFNLPQVLSNDVYYHFSYQSEEKEKYFKYFVYKDVISFQRLSLDTSGALWGMTTNEALKVFLKCERPSFRDGCFGRKYEECFAGKGFTAGKGIMLQSGFKFNEGDKLTLNDCKAMCMNYCSCNAYASTNDDETACEIWSHYWQNFVKKNSDDYRYIYFRQSPFDFESKGSQVLFLCIITAIIGGLFILALLYYFVWIKFQATAKPRIWITIKTLGGLIVLMFRSIYYMTQEKLRSFGKKNREKDILLHELGRRDGKKSHELQFFSFESIAAATNNFTSTSKLGEGGFGSVYKWLYVSKKNYSSYHSERPLNLIGYAWELWGEEILVRGQKLRDGEHLASSGGTSRLEFFSPGSSRNRYVGISFNIADGVLLVANKKVVWVANRFNPIADKSGILMIDELGNFILREQNSDGSTRQVLWQSFDYPTDTLLPGMKLGISMKTTDIWSLTWWISENNPAKGTFTLTAGFKMDDESMLVIWWQGNTYWISGNWQNGHFEFVPRLSNERDISFSYISNENEKYYILPE
nr:g-type lectin s-receptor-like serine/threonine-protein kinase [Quercus suber]